MTTVLIAEKPSVAREIAALVGATERREGYLEGSGWCVSWGFGHLVSLKMPEQIEASWKSWSLDTLPLLPDHIGLQARSNKGVAEQLDVIRKLVGRRDVERIINACDAGREGELIFRYIMDYLGISPSDRRLYRLWTSSLTEQALKQALVDVQPAARWDRLGAAAAARSEADWLVGLNVTRALTCKARASSERAPVLSVGRVQTPTLALVVERDRQRERFVSTPFYEVWAELYTREAPFVGYRARWTAKDGQTRLPDAQQAQAVVDRLKAHASGELARLERKQERVACPRLFDLTSLQREANVRLGLTAQQTLDAAQALYEAKLITYPRTDSRALTEDMVAGLVGMCQALEGWTQWEEVGASASRVQAHVVERAAKRHVRPEEVSDHHAILPTGHKASGAGPDGHASAVLELVVRRTLASLEEEGVDETVHAITQVGEEQLVTRTRSRRTPGWRVVWEAGVRQAAPSPRGKKGAQGKDVAEDRDEAYAGFPVVFEQGQRVRRDRIEVRQGKTEPPAAYTEATLLAAMEHALRGEHEGVEESERAPAGGIGTPATRAAILETLIKERGYIERRGKSLVSSELGRQVVDALGPGQLTSASLTARWELGLEQVEQGKLDAATFRAQVCKLVAQTVAQLKQGAAMQVADPEAVGMCPVCKTKELKSWPKSWSCPDRRCGFVLWREIAGKTLSAAAARQLVAGKTTQTLKGFVSKQGKPFEAALKLAADGKVEFVFEQRAEAKR